VQEIYLHKSNKNTATTFVHFVLLCAEGAEKRKNRNKSKNLCVCYTHLSVLQEGHRLHLRHPLFSRTNGLFPIATFQQVRKKQHTFYTVFARIEKGKITNSCEGPRGFEEEEEQLKTNQ